jgi:hypothetical protein
MARNLILARDHIQRNHIPEISASAPHRRPSGPV